MADDDDYNNRPQPVGKLLLERIEGLRWSIAILVSVLDENGAVKWQRVTEMLRVVANGQHDAGARGPAESLADVADAIEALCTLGVKDRTGRPTLKIVKPDDDPPKGAA